MANFEGGGGRILVKYSPMNKPSSRMPIIIKNK